MSSLPLLTCAFLLALQCSRCAANANPTDINVRDFGALGDGHTDDAPAINRAIAEGVRHGQGTVFIPAGRYHLESGGGGHVKIDHANGLTLKGEPGTILAGENPDAEIISLNHCTRTTVRGLTLEQEKTYFSQGIVDAIAPDGMSCDVTIEPGYDEPDAPQIAVLTTLRSFSYPNSTAYREDRWWPTVKTRTRTGDHKWHFTISGWGLLPDMVKKPFIIWDDRHGGHGLGINDCADCLIEDVDYHGRGTNAGLIINSCPGQITFRRFDITTPPGSGDLLSCSGGGQMIDCRGSLLFEQCWFDKVDDDGSDIFTGYDRVLRQIDAHTIEVQSDRGFLPHDHIAIVDWQTRVDRNQASIINAQLEPGDITRLTLDQPVTILRTGPGNPSGDRTQQSNDGIDRVTDYNLACSSVTYRNCHIQAMRARGLNLKAQNCTVEGCTFYDCEMPAISGGPEFWWGEAPSIHNFTVRNNHFINCNTRCVDIAFFDDSPRCVGKGNRGILIEGNTFTHWAAHGTINLPFTPQCPIRIGNAENVMIRKNHFEAPGAPDRPVRVLIEQSSGVTLEDNDGLPEAAILRR